MTQVASEQAKGSVFPLIGLETLIFYLRILRGPGKHCSSSQMALAGI